MDTELLRKKYYGFGGSDSDEWTVFFEDTPEEQSIFVPGCYFDVAKENGLFRGVIKLPDGDNVVVQDEKIEALPDKMQLAAISAMLRKPDSERFVCRLLAGRMLDVSDECDILMDENGIAFRHCNIELKISNDAAILFQNGKEYKRVNIQDSDLSAQELGALLLAATAPAVTSMAQDELAECLAEKYPDFAQLWIKSYELSNGNAAIYRLVVPSPADPAHKLWVIIGQESANVGMDDFSLCDDICLNCDAVAKYIDSIITEHTLFVAKYKDKKHFEEKNEAEFEWLAAPESPEKLEKNFAKKAKGLSGLFNKGKIIDIFSWNNTFSMTLEL